MQTNYYQLLSVASDASAAEIQVAIDRELSRWMQLVNHHDPSFVLQANQNLSAIEKARTTLLDAGRRAAYDAQQGLGVVGGITEAGGPPRATAGQILTPGAHGMMSASGTGPASRPVVPTRGWICPTCETVNREGSRFCSKCREPLADDCPLCTHLVMKSEIYCPDCGVDIAAGRENVAEWRSLHQKLQLAAGDLQQASGQARLTAQATMQSRGRVTATVLLGVVGAIIIVMLLGGNQSDFGTGLTCLVVYVVLLGIMGLVTWTRYTQNQTKVAEANVQLEATQAQARKLDARVRMVEATLTQLKPDWKQLVRPK